jgi:hypothetical protein
MQQEINKRNNVSMGSGNKQWIYKEKKRKRHEFGDRMGYYDGSKF